MSSGPAFDLMSYKPEGDKKNSVFFEEFLPKVYERRVSSGVDELLSSMAAVMIQVDPGDGINYIEELTIMGPYRFHSAHVDATHKVYVLKNSIKRNTPILLVFEPLAHDYMDDLVRLNLLYPMSREKPHARYIGEIFWSSDVKATREALESQFIRFSTKRVPKRILLQSAHGIHLSKRFRAKGQLGCLGPDLETLNLGGALTEEENPSREADQWAADSGVMNLVMGLDPHGHKGPDGRQGTRDTRIPHLVASLLRCLQHR